MKRFAIILMALVLGLSVSAQRGRYSKGRKPVRTTKRVTPRPATTIKTCPDDNHPHAIDLGLPSGTKWACCNVGASKPTAYGNYYAWGETSPKANYDDDTYKWSKSKWNSEFNYHDYFYTKYCPDSKWGWNGFTDNKTTLDLEDDAARANWGGEWRMPNEEDFNELLEYTTHRWVKNYNGTGVKGYLFTGKNGKRIFLPAAGFRDGTSLDSAGSNGYYWSSSLGSYDPFYAYGPVYVYGLYFYSGYVDVGYGYRRDDCDVFRYYGRTVRPVRP